MIKYWAVNFGFDAVLAHGLAKKLWMMQYQYADEDGNQFEGDRPGVITKNWRRLKEIKPGHQFVAYLPHSTFYATGTVIKPRRAKIAQDIPDTVEAYLKRKRSHEHKKGFVYYTPVFYEDFSDRWRARDDNMTRWPQRIDVDEWRNFIPDGVVVKGLRTIYGIERQELRKAVFEIGKELFEVISSRLLAAKRS